MQRFIWEDEQIMEDEGGNIGVVYLDSLGYPTVGVGHLLTKSEQALYSVGEYVDYPQRVRWFREDLSVAADDAKKLLPKDVPREVYNIVVNMVFNMGRSRFNKKKWPSFFKAIAQKDWQQAADEMVDSSWYNQVGNRSKRLVERMRKVDG